jgi:predicted AlkP superfamily phosphohydrolase/phosphomutase
MKKTLFVGLDAACWEYVEPLLQAGRMPALQELMNSGIWGTLHSTMPPWTPAAWASIATGKNPGKHGVFDMMWRRPGTYEFTPTSAKVRMGTPFWKHLNENGLRVGLVNVPFTYPPDSVEGFVVGGFGTPNSASDITYPPEVLPWIHQEFGHYKPTVDAEFLRTASPPEIFDVEKKHQVTQVNIALQLAKRYQIEVLVINLMFPDHANHKMPDMEQVNEAYRQSDADLNVLIQGFCPDNVMLISDHGSNRLKGNFLLNAWLRDQGYYIQAENTASARTRALNWMLVQWLQVHQGWSGSQEKILRHLAKDSLLKLPNRLTQHFWDKIEDHLPFARDHVMYSDQPNYARTQVFPGSVYSGLLYFNLINRDPTGTISLAERQTLAAEIADKLLEIEEPETGEPLFSNVYPACEVYSGPALEHAPDLIIDSYDKGWNIQASHYVPKVESVSNKYFVGLDQQRDFGWHSRDGIFVFSGQDFNIGPTDNTGHIMDVPATLLHLYGIPIPEDYDGQVLTKLMKPEIGQRPINYQPGDAVLTFFETSDDSYSAEESEELVSHLRSLGYLD